MFISILYLKIEFPICNMDGKLISLRAKYYIYWDNGTISLQTYCPVLSCTLLVKILKCGAPIVHPPSLRRRSSMTQQYAVLPSAETLETLFLSGKYQLLGLRQSCAYFCTAGPAGFINCFMIAPWQLFCRFHWLIISWQNGA